VGELGDFVGDRAGLGNSTDGVIVAFDGSIVADSMINWLVGR